MTAEEAIAAQLARQLGSLSAGHRHRILLEQVVSDGFGRWRNGPHPVGWIERVSPGRVIIRLLATEAGQDCQGAGGGGAPRRRAVARLPAGCQTHGERGGVRLRRPPRNSSFAERGSVEKAVPGDEVAELVKENV